PTRAFIIVVKEDLVRSTLVKSDAGPVAGRTLEALKMNVIADFPTGTYTYHQMASVFFDRHALGVLKESMSHTEGCGITFVRIGPRAATGGPLVQETHSYWDGEADRETPVIWPAGDRPHLWWDALPLSLRPWIERPGVYEQPVWLLPGQVSGRSPVEGARPIEARVRVQDGGTIAVPAGRFDTRKVAVATAAGADLFWFDRRPPHVLVMLETAAGRRLLLARTQRLDYWNHTAPGDEALVEPRAPATPAP
ncbi:MAG TPA: hypothetical protein VI792_11585, partial [Candidatus Eisenbacteria bacterium]